jgi:fucose 4-O-acetylase-like acetyltransferase
MEMRRNSSIDIMRFVGILFIILAHVLPSSSTLFQLRTFDVSLMIFVSGLAYADRKMEAYPQFVWRRLKRLLVPVYLFLILYFLVNWLLSACGIFFMPETEKIIGTFLLIDPNIGYVWVIRIFLTIMLVTPLLMRIESTIKNNVLFGLLITFWLVAQYYLILWLLPLKPGIFINDYILYTTGYAVLFLLGLRMMKRTSVSVQISFFAVLLVAMVCLAIEMAAERGSWLKMQWYKYPPQTYYLVWGALVSLLFWTCRKWWSGFMDKKWINFIGQNTIWIYLWHIPFVEFMNKSFPELHWGIRYAVVCGGAIGVYLLQYWVVQRIASRDKERKYKLLKYLKG